MATDEIVVGVVGKPFGVRGDVYVRPDPDLDHDFPPGTTYRLTDGRVLSVEDSWIHGNRRILRFAEASDRDAAEALRGTVLTVPRSDLELDEGALWVHDLLGREVYDEGEELIGVVEGVRDGHAHDYLVIARTDGGEVLVPLVADLVDLRGDRVVVRAMPGLVDDDADTVS
jgi:16S rRNA processing protein RimM